MNALYFYLIILAHPYLAMWWKSFEIAGRKNWEALLPGYNYFVAFRIGCEKPWWSLLLVFPGVHLVMWSVVNTSYIRRFGYYSLTDTLQGIFFPYLILAKIATKGDKALPPTNWANSKEMGDREWGDHLVLFLSLPVIGHAIALGLNAVTRHKPGKKSKVKEWGDSILFALVAALVIRTYVFEPFKIPTGSMEKTLLVGDFLFVNKLAYGPKVPVTPLSYPLVHNDVPWVHVRSYLNWETSNYTRLPGFGKVERNDVVVFNYPAGDTAIYDPRMPNGLMGHEYEGVLLTEARIAFNESPETKRRRTVIQKECFDIIKKDYQNIPVSDSLRYIISYKVDSLTEDKLLEDFFSNIDKYKGIARSVLAEQKIAHNLNDPNSPPIINHYGLIYRPVDKRENYIKRCVGIPGDWIEIKKSVLYVNNKPAIVAPDQNLHYIVSKFNRLANQTLIEKYGIEPNRQDIVNINPEAGIYSMHLSKWQIKKLELSQPGIAFKLDLPDHQYVRNYKRSNAELYENLRHFPKDIRINNSVTDFERFQIPKKGHTVKIHKDNIAWYRRIIRAYEGHKLEERKDGIYIDGKKRTTYTFAMNYYWLMGDNRYNSADSRVWGFVPEDHIVGKASLVWFSNSGDPDIGIRWERIFKLIK